MKFLFHSSSSPFFSFIVCLSLVFLQWEAFGQSISGTVTDLATSQPLVGATVQVPEWKAGGFTDETGAYTLRPSGSVGGDSITLVVSYTGYDKITLRLPAVAGDINNNVSLTSENYSTDDVIITTSRSIGQKRSDVTISVDLVKPKDIDLQSTTNITDVITQIPGVDDINGQINIRGSSGYAFGIGSRVMVMMDGLPLLSGDASFPELSLIPLDNVAQVEVVKGPSSVLYGSSAIGGVINVIMAHPDDTSRTSVRLRGGLYGNPRNKDLKWGDSPSLFGSAHIFHSQKFGQFDLTLQTDLIKDQGYREFTDKEEFRGIALTRFRPKSIPGLSLGVNVSARLDSSGSHLYWAGYYPVDTLENSTGEDSIVMGGGLRPGREANVLRRQRNTRVALDPFIKYLTPGGNLFWYRGRYLRNINSNNTGQSSQNFVLYNDFLFQTTLAEKINWTSGATVNYSRANSEIYPGGPFNGLNYAIYSQFNGKFGRLSADLGIRYDIFTFSAESDSVDNVLEEDIKRQSRPIFSAGVNYRLWPGANARASFGQAFRVPSVAERFTSTGGGGLIVRPNPNIKSEVGYGAEIGLRQGFEFSGRKSKVRGALDFAVFTRRFNDMVEFGLTELDSTAFFSLNPSFLPVFSSSNVADARINGMELTLNLDAAWKDWFVSFNGGVTLLDPTNLNGIPSEQQEDLSNFERKFNEELANAGGIGEFFALLRKNYDRLNNLNDNPEILKYRSRFTGRFSTAVGYKNISLTANYRHRSFIESIDQYLHLVIDDLYEFRTQINPRGNTTVDFIVAYDTGKTGKFSLNIGNAFNYEYDQFPGTLGEQRKFTLQYVVRF